MSWCSSSWPQRSGTQLTPSTPQVAHLITVTRGGVTQEPKQSEPDAVLHTLGRDTYFWATLVSTLSTDLLYSARLEVSSRFKTSYNPSEIYIPKKYSTRVYNYQERRLFLTRCALSKLGRFSNSTAELAWKSHRMNVNPRLDENCPQNWRRGRAEVANCSGV